MQKQIPETILLNITATDIKRGKRGESSHCPAARAAKRVLKTNNISAWAENIKYYPDADEKSLGPVIRYNPASLQDSYKLRELVRMFDVGGTVFPRKILLKKA